MHHAIDVLTEMALSEGENKDVMYYWVFWNHFSKSYSGYLSEANMFLLF